MNCIYCGNELLELILLDKIFVSEVKKSTEEHIHKSVEAILTATVIYDLLGGSEEDNPARAKDLFWFEEQARQIVESM